MARLVDDHGGLRGEILRRLRAGGARGVTAVEISAVYRHKPVQDGYPERHVAGAAAALSLLVRRGDAARLTNPGRWALYCITKQGLDALRALESAARAASGADDGPPFELSAHDGPVPPASIFENSSFDEPPAGLFD